MLLYIYLFKIIFLEKQKTKKGWYYYLVPTPTLVQNLLLLSTPLGVPCGPGPNYPQNIQVFDSDNNLVYDVCVALSKAPLMKYHKIASPSTMIVVLSSSVRIPMPTKIHFNKFDDF